MFKLKFKHALSINLQLAGYGVFVAGSLSMPRALRIDLMAIPGYLSLPVMVREAGVFFPVKVMYRFRNLKKGWVIDPVCYSASTLALNTLSPI